MYTTVEDLIQTLAKQHNLRVEILFGDDEGDGNGTADDYYYVTVYNRFNGVERGWNYSLSLFGALEHLVRLADRGELD
jgi:hypothetical protein